MTTDRQAAIAETLFGNAGRLSYGTVSVELKIHGGKCVGVTHTCSENTRVTESGEGATPPPPPTKARSPTRHSR